MCDTPFLYVYFHMKNAIIAVNIVEVIEQTWICRDKLKPINPSPQQLRFVAVWQTLFHTRTVCLNQTNLKKHKE